MEHHLKIVASNFQLDEKKLTAFALKNKSQYGIIDEDGFVTTTTLFTEKLVNDFRKSIKKPKRKISKFTKLFRKFVKENAFGPIKGLYKCSGYSWMMPLAELKKRYKKDFYDVMVADNQI